MTDEAAHRPPEDPIDAVVFDMDGVITDTARAHFAAWKSVFDSVLERHVGAGAPPFDMAEYLEHVDGVPRLDGVRGFLAGRGIGLPETGDADRSLDSVAGIGALKNDRFRDYLARGAVDAFEDAIAFLTTLRAAGIATGIFTSSRNAEAVLSSAGVTDLFSARIDGNDAHAGGLPGKPDPAILLETARRLGVAPERAMVVEDALLGVEAGRRGGFRHVVGVDRTGPTSGHAFDLADHGADLVTTDLRRLLSADGALNRTIALPDAEARIEDIGDALGGARSAIVLDLCGPGLSLPGRHAAAVPELAAAIAATADAGTRIVVHAPPASDLGALAGKGAVTLVEAPDPAGASAPSPGMAGSSDVARMIAREIADRAAEAAGAGPSILVVADEAGAARLSPLVRDGSRTIVLGGGNAVTTADARLGALGRLPALLTALARRLP